MIIFGLELMILNKREVLLELTEVKYHGRIGLPVSQTIMVIRMGSQSGAGTMGVGVI